MNRMGKGLQSILNAVAIVKERKPGRGKKRKKKVSGGKQNTSVWLPVLPRLAHLSVDGKSTDRLRSEQPRYAQNAPGIP